MDLMIVIDRSGSREGVFRQQSDFVKEVIDGVDFGFKRTQVGVVLYDDTAETVFGMDKYSKRADVRNAITFVDRPGRKTNTPAGLREMMKNFKNKVDRPTVRQVAIVLTDGHTNVNNEQTKQIADEAKRSGIKIFAIGFGTNINRQELEDIASTPHTTYLHTSDRSPKKLAPKVLEKLCTT